MGSQACAGVSPEEWGFAEKRKQPADEAFKLAKVAKVKPEDEVPVKIIFPSERQGESLALPHSAHLSEA